MKEKKIKRLFYDIETSPNIALIWRPGMKVSVPHENIIKERAIMCISYKWEGEKETHCLTWDKKQNDKKMLEKFIPILTSSDEACGHNIEGYDHKWVRTRCLYHGISIPPKIKHVDTLKIARSMFAFNSNRLDYIAKFLGQEGKIKMSFESWKKILISNDSKEFAKMIKYCKQDVKELEKVFQQLNPYIPASTHTAVLHGGYSHDCPECGSIDSILSKTRVNASGSITRQMKCKGCHKYYTISDKAYKRKLES